MTERGSGFFVVLLVVAAILIAIGFWYSKTYTQPAQPSDAAGNVANTSEIGASSSITSSEPIIQPTPDFNSYDGSASTSSFISYHSNILGLSFSYPGYFGRIKEAIDSFGDDNISFISSTTRTPDMTYDINFWPTNSSTDFTDGGGSVYQYTGGTLSAACSSAKPYFDTYDYFIQFDYCDIKTLPTGVMVAQFGGSFSPSAGIRAEPDVYEFEGAFVQTKSSEFPGMMIYSDSQEIDQASYARGSSYLDRVINSLAY